DGVDAEGGGQRADGEGRFQDDGPRRFDGAGAFEPPPGVVESAALRLVVGADDLAANDLHLGLLALLGTLRALAAAIFAAGNRLLGAGAALALLVAVVGVVDDLGAARDVNRGFEQVLHADRLRLRHLLRREPLE